MLNRLLLLFLLLLVSINFPILVLAAEGEASGSAIYTPDEDKTKTDRFIQLRQDYLFQLEKYKEAERQFELDKAEFNKLQTLASREKAVLSMKPYLIARAKVLFTYLVALEYLLQDSQGVDVTDLDLTLKQLNQSKQELLDYQKSVESISDREGANQSSKFFEASVREKFLESQFRALTLLSLGRVQRAFDQYSLATYEFKEKYVAAIDDNVLKARIERGLKDVDFQNEAAKTSLSKVVKEYPDFLTQDELVEQKTGKPNYQSVYNNAVKDLQTSFSAMKRSIQFLKELEMQI